MATSTTTTADKILLDEVEPEIAKAFSEEVLGFELATKKTNKFSGRRALFDVQMTRGSGVGGRAETGALPTPVAPVHVNGEVGVKNLYGVLELSHSLIETSKGKGAAFREALTDQLESTMNRMKKYANFNFYGAGNGILATVVSAGGTLAAADASTQTVVVDTTRYLEPGDIIAFWTDATDTSTVLANGGQTNVLGTADSEHVYIASVDSDTQITVARSAAAADVATIVAGNTIRLYGDKSASTAAGNNVPMGLRGIADDGTLFTTFEGISRATYPRWKGLVIAAGSTAEGATLHKNHFIKQAHRVHRNANTELDTFIMDPTLMREFLAITDPDHRFAPVKEYDPGFSKEALQITIGSKSVPLFMDYDCPFGVLYGFPRSKLEWWSLTDLELDANNGSVLKQAKPYGAGSGAGDIFYAYFRMKGNWATKHPNCFSVTTGLSYSSEVA